MQLSLHFLECPAAPDVLVQPSHPCHNRLLMFPGLFPNCLFLPISVTSWKGVQIGLPVFRTLNLTLVGM